MLKRTLGAIGSRPSEEKGGAVMSVLQDALIKENSGTMREREREREEVWMRRGQELERKTLAKHLQ